MTASKFLADRNPPLASDEDANHVHTPKVIAQGGVNPANGTALATAQVTVDTSADLILAAATGRIEATIKNTSDTVTVFVGPDNTVLATTGHALAPGEILNLGQAYRGAIYGITASGSAVVTTAEIT